MTRHRFGGDWTEDKLDRIRKYLIPYVTILRKYAYRTTYVDAFAGTGQRSDKSTSIGENDLFGEVIDHDREEFKKGSARIALESEPPFDQYVFVERNPEFASELEILTKEFPSRNTRIERIDANLFLPLWCQTTKWSQNRAVVFLDPYGMQVNWATIKAIATTKAIDLWLLFPLGVAVNRLLTRDAPPPDAWSNALDRIFGTDEWRKLFYARRKSTTLFEEADEEERIVHPNEVGEFFLDRLRTVFAGVSPHPLPLSNSRGQVIYLLCFAAGNQKGAKTAVKIADHILRQ